MLARIAQELFWLGRDLTRAEHTARILDGAFHTDVAGVPGERGITFSWEGVLATIGAKPPAPGEEESAVPTVSLGRAEVARLLTLDTDSPASVVSCVARARERGRTIRDVISTEMWEALNSFHLLPGRYDLPVVNFSIRYLTEYDYDADVVDNLNALRVKPHANGRQRVDEFSVRLAPEARLHRHTDYFGTEVVEFEVSHPHRHLTIDVRARVGTKESIELIPDRFEYRQGATYVDSDIADLLAAGAGVCQDFVHLGLCLLRHHGVAARYVSGYLFAGGSGDGHESIEVDTHAWLEALLPVADGGEPVWVGADPTNRVLAGETHVKIGHGHHYSDAPPIKGVYPGAATAKLDASVTMTRLERTDPASIARS
jgi:transglutaminase-like putative cysteine protease